MYPVAHRTLADVEFFRRYSEMGEQLAIRCRLVGVTGETILSRRGPADYTPALNFHWRETMKLCAGMDASLKGLAPMTSRVQPLSTLLGVKKTRASGAVPTPIVSLSGCLRKESIEASCRPGLAFLSAFDMRAWSHLQNGVGAG